jgi:peroxiredoxin
MSSSKTQRALTISIVVLTMLLVYTIAQRLQERIVTVGESAPEFSITTEHGRTISASNFGGKLLVLNFWATWCPPCVEETPSLSRFAGQMAPSGVVVLAVSVDKNEKLYRDFLARHKPQFLVARDVAQKISSDYGTYKYPETYVIDTRGKVVRKFISDQPWDSANMINDIKSLL